MRKHPSTNQIPQNLKKASFYFILLITTITVIPFLLKQAKARIFNSQKTFVSTSPTLFPIPTDTSPTFRTYSNSDFYYQFSFPSAVEGCPYYLSTSRPWQTEDKIYGIDLYCTRDTNLVQVITQKTDKDALEWWYSLLPENESFFKKYGEEKRITFVGQDAIQISYPKKSPENDHINRVEVLVSRNGNNYLIVMPDYGCREEGCWQGVVESEVLSRFEFTDQTKTTEDAEGQICGGILGRACPSSYTCEYDSNSPDASGKCKKIR